MNKKITIGSRGSKLALLYAQKAKDTIVKVTNLGDEDVQIKAITTKGDQVQDTRLSEIGGKGLFSSNIEKELKDKNIDIAVHALKDLPAIETNGLITDTFLERTDPREILISENKKKLRELKSKAIIGTSSFRREYQIKKIRPDINCKLIRGNVDTRLKKLKDGLYNAIILSYAGIKYLELEKEISEIELILVMSVYPGFGGQKFIPNIISKIQTLKKIRNEKNLNFDIEVDGGINFTNSKSVIEAGANILVSGTTVFKENNGNIKKNIETLKLV